VYLPATSSALRALLEVRELSAVGTDPVTAFAVTPGLREWYVDDDVEELEYAALLEAARASLRLIDADPSAARRRVVLAADVADGQVELRDDLDRGVVRVRGPLALAAIASVHVDDADAEAAVTAAAQSIDAADLGDESAQDRVDDAEGFELSWFATQELADLLGSF
jgi:hypothetical protein